MNKKYKKNRRANLFIPSPPTLQAPAAPATQYFPFVKKKKKMIFLNTNIKKRTIRENKDKREKRELTPFHFPSFSGAVLFMAAL